MLSEDEEEQRKNVKINKLENLPHKKDINKQKNMEIE